MAEQPAGLAEQLKQAIRESGMSLTRLGQATGVDSGRLSRFMRGERDLTLEASARLCGALGMELTPPAGKARNQPTPPAGELEAARKKPRGRARKGSKNQ